MADESKMTLVEHLRELRYRILYAVMAWAACSAGAYFYTPRLLSFFTSMIDVKLVFVNPMEAFLAYLKIAMLLGLFASLPIVLYQLLSFIIPGLKAQEKKLVLRLLPMAIILFLLGMLFAYFIIIPVALKFFLSFATKDLVPMISIGSLVSFVLTLLIVCGLIFQTPLAILFLALLGIVNSRLLRERRRYMILFFFIISMIITPTPDAFTQIVMALPMIILYEISILIVCLVERKRKITSEA